MREMGRPYYKPLVMALLILASGVYFYLQPATNPFLTFVRVWCFLAAYGVVSNFAEQLRFYRWWQCSELSDADARGLGTNGFPVFGFIPMPRLSLWQLRVVGLSYAAGLILCALLADRPFVGYLFLCVLVLALLYFSSLWAERNASYHREYVTIAVLIYLCLTPDFYGVASASKAIVFLIQLHVSSIYVAGALQKTACSFFSKTPWFACAPHSFLWRAMWSKPYYKSFQRYFFLRPRLVAACSLVILVLELFFFVNFKLPYELRILMAGCMIAFHASVFILQGIDYITFWSPVFVLWFIVPGFDSSAVLFDASWWMVPAMLFCLAQLVYAFTFIEDLNVNIPPFTCCPMFVNVCTFNERVPQYYCMWDMRSPLVLERLEWSYPFIKAECGMGMVPSDLPKFPFGFVGFGYYVEPKGLPLLQQKWFHTDLIGGEGFFVFANFPISPALKANLSEFMTWLHEQEHERSIFDEAFLAESLTRYNSCHLMFAGEIGAGTNAHVYGAENVAIA